MHAALLGRKGSACVKIMTPSTLKLRADPSQMITQDAGSPVPFQQADNRDLKGLRNNCEYEGPNDHKSPTHRAETVQANVQRRARDPKTFSSAIRYLSQTAASAASSISGAIRLIQGDPWRHPQSSLNSNISNISNILGGHKLRASSASSWISK